jgi:hypothetical protein
MVSDYGTSIFINILNSHNNTSFLLRLTNIDYFIKEIIYNFSLFAQSYELTIFWVGLLGLLFSLYSRQWLLPVWLLSVITFMSEYLRFVIMIFGLLAANFLVIFISGYFSTKRNQINRNNIIRMLLTLFFIAINTAINFKWMISSKPSISDQTINLATWFQKNTSNDSKYLYISRDEAEAEWLPYLFKRVPSVGHWGAEWLGNYQQQWYITTIEIPNCFLDNNFVCINRLIEYQS